MNQQDIKVGESVALPCQVLMQQGVVAAVFGPDAPRNVHSTAKFIALMTGKPVFIHQVDASLPWPLPPGTRLDPESLGWVKTGITS